MVLAAGTVSFTGVSSAGLPAGFITMSLGDVTLGGAVAEGAAGLVAVVFCVGGGGGDTLAFRPQAAVKTTKDISAIHHPAAATRRTGSGSQRFTGMGFSSMADPGSRNNCPVGFRQSGAVVDATVCPKGFRVERIAY
jgi:hypothetical protein